jgi:TPR repeat protein
MGNMNDQEPTDTAEQLFTEGKKFDWKQDKSHVAALLARASFQQAAEMGHKAAARALAHMVYEGRGGAADRVLGLLLLWSAFRRGDYEALEEFSDLLTSFGEDKTAGQQTIRAAHLAPSLEALVGALGEADQFMQELASKRAQSSSS